MQKTTSSLPVPSTADRAKLFPSLETVSQLSSRTCFGISKIANLLKLLDSEIILKRVQHRIQNDKIGITYIVTQSLTRRGQRGGCINFRKNSST